MWLCLAGSGRTARQLPATMAGARQDMRTRIPSIISTCRLMRRRIKVADPRIFLIYIRRVYSYTRGSSSTRGSSFVAENFYGRDRQNAFFDIRVFNPYAPSRRGTTLAQCYRRNELEKKCVYEERVTEVEHGSFSPLVFSTSGGMGPIATVVYKRIATIIADKRKQPYSRTLFWIRCKLSFSLLRSAIMCIKVLMSSPDWLGSN